MQESPGTAATADADWRALPRTSLDWIAMIALDARAANAAQLLRDTKLNPRDLCLPMDARTAISDLIAATLRDVVAAHSAFEAARDREFAAAMAGGNTVAVDFATSGSLQLATVRPDPLFAEIDGVTFAASQDHLPESRRARRHLRELSQNLALHVVDAFETAGALDAAEAAALRARVADLGQEQGPR